MPRFTAEEIKGAWEVSPRIAHNQAEKALPDIEKEISALKQERDIITDVLERELPPKPKKAAMGDNDTGNTQEYARGDAGEEAITAGSLDKQPEEAKA